MPSVIYQSPLKLLMSERRLAWEIASGYTNLKTRDWEIELDRRVAIDRVIRLARPGGVVLITGKGHETYQEIQHTVVPFDDRLYATETLENLGFTG